MVRMSYKISNKRYGYTIIAIISFILCLIIYTLNLKITWPSVEISNEIIGYEVDINTHMILTPKIMYKNDCSTWYFNNSFHILTKKEVIDIILQFDFIIIGSSIQRRLTHYLNGFVTFDKIIGETDKKGKQFNKTFNKISMVTNLYRQSSINKTIYNILKSKNFLNMLSFRINKLNRKIILYLELSFYEKQFFNDKKKILFIERLNTVIDKLFDTLNENFYLNDKILIYFLSPMVCQHMKKWNESGLFGINMNMQLHPWINNLYDKIIHFRKRHKRHYNDIQIVDTFRMFLNTSDFYRDKCFDETNSWVHLNSLGRLIHLQTFFNTVKMSINMAYY